MPLLQAMTKPSNIFFNKLLSELEYSACPSPEFLTSDFGYRTSGIRFSLIIHGYQPGLSLNHIKGTPLFSLSRNFTLIAQLVPGWFQARL